jgi:hypothetical protein
MPLTKSRRTANKITISFNNYRTEEARCLHLKSRTPSCQSTITRIQINNCFSKPSYRPPTSSKIHTVTVSASGSLVGMQDASRPITSFRIIVVLSTFKTILSRRLILTTSLKKITFKETPICCLRRDRSNPVISKRRYYCLVRTLKIYSFLTFREEVCQNAALKMKVRHPLSLIKHCCL